MIFIALGASKMYNLKLRKEYNMENLALPALRKSPKKVYVNCCIEAYGCEVYDELDAKADNDANAVYIDFEISPADTTDSQISGSPAWADSMLIHAPGLGDAVSPVEFIVGPTIAGARAAGAGARVVARTVAKEAAEEAVVTTGQEVGGAVLEKVTDD